MIDSPLRIALQQCSLHALLMIVSKTLTRAGLGDVQIMDRRKSTQRTRFGGHELLCETYLNNRPIKIVVKVISDAVRMRMLDELAGVTLRTKADSALVVTPFHVTRTAAKVLGEHHPVRIETIDGLELEKLLLKFGIGVRGKGEVDYAFFGGLEQVSARLLDFLDQKPV
jgi:restriction endonuclease Mrr